VTAAPALVCRAETQMTRALAEWRHVEARLWEAARSYMVAVAAESDALVAVATLIAAGAPAQEVHEARTVLAHAMATRDGAGRRLRLPAGLPVVVARAAEDLLSAARITRAGAQR
jgi:hypothetical protein